MYKINSSLMQESLLFIALCQTVFFGGGAKLKFGTKFKKYWGTKRYFRPSQKLLGGDRLLCPRDRRP